MEAQENADLDEPVFKFTLPQCIINIAAKLKANQHRNMNVRIAPAADKKNTILNISKPNSKFLTFTIPSRYLTSDDVGSLECYVENVEVQKKANKRSLEVSEEGEKNAVDEQEESETKKIKTKPAGEPIVLPVEDGKRYSMRPGRRRIVQLLKSGRHPTNDEMVVQTQVEKVMAEDVSEEGEEDECSKDVEDHDYEHKQIKKKRGQGLLPKKTVLHRHRRPNYKREANIPCEFCGLKYKDNLVLFGHVRFMHASHPDKKEYQDRLKEKMKVACDICQKVSKNKLLLKEHKIRMHPEALGLSQELKFPCQSCDQVFAHTVLLRDHVNRVHNLKQKQMSLCHLCPKKFTTAVAMRDHVDYVHEKQFLFQCEICKKTFHSPRYLKRHMMVHSQVFTKCDHCSYTTKHLYNLKRHVQDMHQEYDKKKLVSCLLCDKEFRNAQNMEVHLNYVHYKITPYYCSLCKKYLSRKNELMEHAEKFHPGMVVLASEENKISKTDGGRYKEPKMQIVDRDILFLATSENSESIKVQLEEFQPAEVAIQVETQPKEGAMDQELSDTISAAAVLESLVGEVVTLGEQAQ